MSYFSKGEQIEGGNIVLSFGKKDTCIPVGEPDRRTHFKSGFSFSCKKIRNIFRNGRSKQRSDIGLLGLSAHKIGFLWLEKCLITPTLFKGIKSLSLFVYGVGWLIYWRRDSFHHHHHHGPFEPIESVHQYLLVRSHSSSPQALLNPNSVQSLWRLGLQ